MQWSWIYRAYLLLRFSKKELRPSLVSRISFACFSVIDWKTQYLANYMNRRVAFRQKKLRIKSFASTILASSILIGEMYWVLTNHETPISLGRSFLLIPSCLIGVTTSSSRNSSSSSGVMGEYIGGGLKHKKYIR